MKRRKFVKTAAMATAASPMLWGTSKSWAGATDRVNVAVIGIRGMGQSHIRAYQNLENVSVVALCDVDENLFPERIQKLFVEKNLPKPKQYHDIRNLLEDKDVDAVSIVTPNHWHALASIWSMQAGKHVSVEKPCCHNFFEGQQLVKAAKKENSLDVAAQTLGLGVRNSGLLKENDPLEEIDPSGSISMTLFNIEEKEISSPIYTYQGVGLAQLMKIEPPRPADFDEVKQEVTEDFIALEKKELAVERIKKVKQDLSRKSLEDLAEDHNLEYKTVEEDYAICDFQDIGNLVLG